MTLILDSIKRMLHTSIKSQRRIKVDKFMTAVGINANIKIHNILLLLSINCLYILILINGIMEQTVHETKELQCSKDYVEAQNIIYLIKNISK